LDPGGWGWSDRRTTPAGHAEHAYQGLAAEAWPRAVEHLDAADEATLTPQVERQLLPLTDQPVDAEIFGEAVMVYQTNGHHVDVIAFGEEVQCAEPTISVPVLRVSDANNIAVNAKADPLLA